jgi:hypothetical protein
VDGGEILLLLLLMLLLAVVLRYAPVWRFWKETVLPWLEREAGHKPDDTQR